MNLVSLLSAGITGICCHQQKFLLIILTYAELLGRLKMSNKMTDAPFFAQKVYVAVKGLEFEISRSGKNRSKKPLVTFIF